MNVRRAKWVKKWNGKGYDENGKVIYELINGNGKVKEYDNYGKLEFEGEYLDGKRNGKGKEYSLGQLTFDGEYLKGRKTGKGKEYYFDGKISFEGEYLNGERHGKGKEYDGDGNIEFEGEYLNGRRKEEK